MVRDLPVMVDTLNRRCPTPYVRGVKTQNKPINTNFEKFVWVTAYETLRRMGLLVQNAVSEHLSDTALEWEEGILQLDAKGCHVDDQDFTLYTKGFKIHCGDTQTCVDSQHGEKTIKGLQMPINDGKVVHTLLTFLKWGYSDKYYIHSFGWADTSPPSHCKIDAGGKSATEMRFFITDSRYYQVVYLRDGQIVDSVQSEYIEDQVVEQQDQ